MAILFESDLKLPRNPQENLHAAPKQYVDVGLSTKADTVHTHTVTQLVGLGTAAICDTGTAVGNVPVIGPDGKLNASVLPSITTNNTFVVASETAMLALTAQTGDVAVRTDVSKSFILLREPATTLANWQELLTPTSAVASVNGKTGTVILVATDVGAIAVTEKGAANGVATLDASVKVPIAQLPTQAVVADSASEIPTGAAVFVHTSATTAHESTSTPTADRIAMFDASGRLHSGMPVANSDVATKQYVDTRSGSGGYRGTFSGDGSQTTFAVTHALGSEEVVADVFRISANGPERIFVQWETASANVINLLFALPPTNGTEFIVKVRT